MSYGGYQQYGGNPYGQSGQAEEGYGASNPYGGTGGGYGASNPYGGTGGGYGASEQYDAPVSRAAALMLSYHTCAQSF
jgi:hypothetical protein